MRIPNVLSGKEFAGRLETPRRYDIMVGPTSIGIPQFKGGSPMRRFAALTLTFLFLLLTGCESAPVSGSSGTASSLPPASSAASSAPDDGLDALFDGDQLYAAAYLGYEEMGDLSYFTENGFIDGTPPIHHVSGGEYYLIIPRYPDMTLHLYRRRLDHDMGVLDLFYEAENAGPFILCCNVSDIFPDVTVLLTRGEDSAKFTPCISLKDGSIQLGDRGLDITQLS